VLVHCGVANLVLFPQRVVIVIIRMFMTGFVVRSLDTPQTALKGRSPTTLTLVATVKTKEAQKDGAFRKVGAKSAPKCVPLTGLPRPTEELKAQVSL
jgi:hypothetical protein